MPDQENNANEVPHWFSDMCVLELLLPHKIIRMFCPKRPLPRNMLSLAHIGLIGSFGTLLSGWLVVVVHGLYLTRHLFFYYFHLFFTKKVKIFELFLL